MFAGSDGGAEHWAVIASLIETCKLNDVDPYAYLAADHHEDRQRPSQQPPRRAPAVGLSRRHRPQRRGLCKLTDVEPHTYLAETITKIVNGHPNSRLDELLPWAYPAATALKHVA